MELNESKVFYVYAWYYIKTGEVFYIGKGKTCDINQCSAEILIF